MRRGLLAVTLVLLAGLAWWRFSTGDGEPAPPVPPPAVKALLQPAQEMPAPAQSVEAGTAKPAPTAGRLRRVDLAYRHRLGGEYLNADDHMEFVRQLLPKAHAGDTEAMVLIAEALRTCAQVKKRAAASEGQATADTAALKSSLHDCGGLEDAAPDEFGSVQQWLKQAADQGNGMAQLLLARSAEAALGMEQRQAELHAAIDSGDPMVVNDMVMMAGAAASTTGKPVSTRTEIAERNLVLCELGYDCSASGPVYAALYCQSKGCLHADGVRRYFELSMSPADYAEVQAYSRRLAADLRSGRYDWPEAQLLEQEVQEAARDDGTGDTNQTGNHP